jgi:hypothetical protein
MRSNSGAAQTHAFYLFQMLEIFYHYRVLRNRSGVRSVTTPASVLTKPMAIAAAES